ncbi:MAG: hypothetical protein E7658_09090 [Ruminococcaceae bacterium]|nr:hypothetical protein [Oscillospiraceae bacterium]
MRRYRRRSNQNTKFVFRRILFVLVCAACITGLAILTGNLLKNMVEKADERLESLESTLEDAPETTDGMDDIGFSGDVYSDLTVSASGVILKNHTSEDNLVLRVNTIAENYDTVSVTLSDENGIVYSSPALIQALRLPAGDGDGSFESLVSLCTAAKAAGLRISGVLSSSLPVMDADTAALVDGTLAGELYSLGFDEVLFSDIMPEETDRDRIEIAENYLKSIRSAVGDGLCIGTVLPLSVYRDVSFTQQIQMIASVVDFLAVDFTEITVINNEPDMTLESVCLALKGTFQVYNLRIVLANPNMEQLAEQYNLLTAMELTNIHFIGEITPSVLSDALTADTAETADETETEAETAGDPVPQRNPYATSGSNGSDSGDGDETEKETTYQSGESGSSWY